VPRIAMGKALAGLAHAAIDISDGLVADLTHICERSHLAATIECDRVPMSAGLLSVRADLRDACALAGGDDYELCFTAATARRAGIESLAVTQGVAITRIGTMLAPREGVLVQVIDGAGKQIDLPTAGFDHFAVAAS
jgi:thiamine-monophosphate kinase